MDEHIFDKISDVDIKKTMEEYYIDYSMSVIAQRALLIFGLKLNPSIVPLTMVFKRSHL